MRLYLSSVLETTQSYQCKIEDIWDISNLYILQSFAYAKPSHIEYYSRCKGFLMDSGAFTIMNSKSRKDTFDIRKFNRDYANFVKKNNIDDFFELDIDSVFGFDVYKDCLHQLQDITGKEPIRVFHDWRGKEYFECCCQKYPRIALGGVAKGNTQHLWRKNMEWFTDVANRYGCKIHGLGVTDPNIIRRCNFYSIDSSSWTAGGRFGTVYRFNGRQVEHYDMSRKNCPDGKQLDKNSALSVSSEAWSLYAKYLDSEY